MTPEDAYTAADLVLDWGMLAYVVAQVALVLVLRGAWRWAAGVPLGVMGPLIVLAAVFDSAHNLLFLVVLFACVPALAYLAVIASLRVVWWLAAFGMRGGGGSPPALGAGRS